MKKSAWIPDNMGVPRPENPHHERLPDVNKLSYSLSTPPARRNLTPRQSCHNTSAVGNNVPNAAVAMSHPVTLFEVAGRASSP